MSVQVRIPTILRSYTGGAAEVTAAAGTLREIIAGLTPPTRAWAAGCWTTAASCAVLSTFTWARKTCGSPRDSTRRWPPEPGSRSSPRWPAEPASLYGGHH